jgi:hypothetical protein
MNQYLPEGLIVLHNRFAHDHIPHAFGGAIALAYWGVPRATTDIDINIFLSKNQRVRVLDSIGTTFPLTNRADAERQIEHTAQVRLRWGAIPVDLFFSNTPFHEAMATRTHEVDYVGTPIPVLSAEDLVICKYLFNRGKDWTDIETIVQVQAHLDEPYLMQWLTEFSEADDERLARLERMLREQSRGGGPERQS